MSKPPSVLKISVGVDYPFLLTPLEYVNYKVAWKVQSQVFPLFHFPNGDITQNPTAFSDRMLPNNDWVQTFIGRVFDHFDAKNDTNATTQDYEKSLMDQLNWASHLGLKTVIIPFSFVKSLSVANLSRCLLHHLHRTSFGQSLLVSLPIFLNDDEEHEDAWYLWHQIQQFVEYHPQVAVHLVLPPSSINHINPSQVQRWIAEPVRYISIETSAFVANDAGYPTLPKLWQSVVKTFLSYSVGLILQGEAHCLRPPPLTLTNDSEDEDDGDQDTEKMEKVRRLHYYVEYVRYMQGQVDASLDDVSRYSYSYWDALQMPLQPLMDHLESQTYEVFEQDPVKYRNYQKAIGKALLHISHAVLGVATTPEQADAATEALPPPGLQIVSGNPPNTSHEHNAPHKRPRVDKDRKVIVMVVGAGRGPLVSATLLAASDVNVPVYIYAVEKNPNAVITLRDRAKQERWQGQVEIIAGDMRHLRNLPIKGDILVSELLGSFGDNELSPECLDAAQALLLNPIHGVSVPTKYTSYLRPIAAPLHWMAARDMSRAGGAASFGGTSGNFQHQFSGRNGTNMVGLETPYVVYLRRFLPLTSTSTPLWQFDHPVPLENNDGLAGGPDNRRHANVAFTIERTGCLTGFAGYFDCDLFADETLSIVPQTHSEGMFSWFPIYFPLHQPIDVAAGQTIALDIWRCVDEHRVWYEWCVVSPVRTAIHNIQGRSSCVGL